MNIYLELEQGEKKTIQIKDTDIFISIKRLGNDIVLGGVGWKEHYDYWGEKDNE